MTLTYKFDPEDNYGFEKDLSQGDMEKYFHSLSTEEQMDAVKASFESFSKEDQHNILKDMEEANWACPDFGRWLEEDIDFCIDLFLEAEDLFEDELHDFFEDEAYNEYESEPRHLSDPYREIGMRHSDFY